MASVMITPRFFLLSSGWIHRQYSAMIRIYSTFSANDVDCDGTPSVDDCDDTDPSLNDLDLDLDGTSTCEYDCDDTDPGLTGFQGGGCPMGSSCLDILGTEYDVGTRCTPLIQLGADLNLLQRIL